MTRKTRLNPLKDDVIIFGEDPAEQTKSGLFLVPDPNNKRRPETGWIVAIGPGRADENGKIRPIEVKVGQKVVFNHWEAKETRFDNQVHFIVAEKEILAILEG